MAWVIKDRRILIIPTKTPDRYDSIPVREVRKASDDVYLIAMPHTYTTLTLLNNIGVTPDAPSPYSLYAPELFVRGVYPMKEAQNITADFICQNKQCYVLHPPRMGKTNMALAAINYLKLEDHKPQGRNAALVVAPLTLLRDAWVAEAPRFVPGLKVNFLFGTKDKRRELLDDPADLYLINCDGVELLKDELRDAAKSHKISTVIVDEQTEYKNVKTQKFNVLYPIVRMMDRVVGMTGTVGDEEDVYGQIKMITPQRLEKKNYRITKKIWLDMTTIEVGPYRRRPKVGSKKIIHDFMQPAIRFEKKDVFDVPQLIEDTFESEMTSQQLKAYNIMKNDSIVGIQEGTITAVNAGVKAAKLLQISAGSVIVDPNGEDKDTTIKELDIKNHMTNLEAMIKESETKVVIYSSWTATINRLVKELEKRHIHAVKYDGKMSSAKRQEALDYWRDHENCKVIVMHPITGAYGIELAAADTLIFYGAPRNGKIVYDQAHERLMSSQQKSLTPKIIHMVLSPADRVAFRNLLSDSTNAKSTMEEFTEMVNS